VIFGDQTFMAEKSLATYGDHPSRTSTAGRSSLQPHASLEFGDPRIDACAIEEDIGTG
jgi:hypothetical protein